MIILDALKSRIEHIDRRTLFRYCIIYMVGCAVFVAGFFVYHVYMMHDMQVKMKNLNQTRKTLQGILTDFQTVRNQRDKVDALLAKNKTFNIQKFYQDLVQKYGVAGSSSMKFNQQKLSNGYFEESLQVSMNQIDTKQMCEILLDIENNPIVYIIGVDITKAGAMKKINLTMSIATLRPAE